MEANSSGYIILVKFSAAHINAIKLFLVSLLHASCCDIKQKWISC